MLSSHISINLDSKHDLSVNNHIVDNSQLKKKMGSKNIVDINDKLKFIPLNSEFSIQDIKESLFIVPSIGSIGLLGQLTIDVIVDQIQDKLVAFINKDEQYKFGKPTLIGYLESFLLEPVLAISSDENNKEILHNAIDIYSVPIYKGSEKISDSIPKLIVLQIRSYPKYKSSNLFSKSLITYLVDSCQSKGLILVSGLDSGRRPNEMISNYNFGPVLFSNQFIEKDASKDLFNGISNISEYFSNKPLDLISEIPYPGSMTGKFSFENSISKGLPTILLSYFTSDGDNAPVALKFSKDLYTLLVSIYNPLLSLSSSSDINSLLEKGIKFEYPKSWKGIYGDDNYTRELYM